METYRRGRNETDSKSVCPKGHEGSNPSVSAFSDYGLAIWQVLFLLARIYWTKGIEQVLASAVMYVQVETRRTVKYVKNGNEDTSRTPARHFFIAFPKRENKT